MTDPKPKPMSVEEAIEKVYLVCDWWYCRPEKEWPPAIVAALAVLRGLVAKNDEERREPTLEWDKPMTSKQASRYFLTGGFVPVELYRSLRLSPALATPTVLADENAALKDRIATLDHDFWAMVSEHQREVAKLKAELSSLRSEADAARPLIEAIKDGPLSSPLVMHELRALSIAYRAVKEGDK